MLRSPVTPDNERQTITALQDLAAELQNAIANVWPSRDATASAAPAQKPSSR